MPAQPTTHCLDVPGGQIYYEVRGAFLDIDTMEQYERIIAADRRRR